MLKVYFACSIRGGRDDAELYADLVSMITQKAEVLTEIFADKKLTSQGMNKPSRTIWETDLTWVKQADILIAEVSNPSLGVGYEIAKAEEWQKPILCLYNPRPGSKLSAMIEGSPMVTIAKYADLSSANVHIDNFIAKCKK